MATKILAESIERLKYEDLGKQTREMAKQCFLDWLACCIRGSEQLPAVIVRRVSAMEGDTAKVSTVFSPTPYRTSSLQAALANGAASHALDMDDLHNASIIHLATVVVPAALAVAEKIDASGKDLITSIVAGYEIGARVGESVNPDSYFFWHTTATAGTFGAAAAAAKLLKLDSQQSIYCLGSAGTQAAGLWEFLIDGAMSKTLHAGKAALNGILAANLSKEGFTAASKILEGEKGFCRAMTTKPKLNKLTEGLGKGFKIDENSFKPYACCKHCHASINATQLIRSKNSLDISQVQSILIKTNKVADNLVNNPNPQTVYGYKFSIQYCVAAAMRYGKVGVDEFTQEKTEDKELKRLMGAITVKIDPELDAEYERNPEKWSAEVIAKTFDGKEYREFVPYPKGDPQNAVSYAETEEKFRTLVGPVYDAGRIERLLQTVRNMEEAASMAKAFAFLTE